MTVTCAHLQHKIKGKQDSQGETLIPHWIECWADGLGLLLAVALGVWNQFEFNIGVWQAVWIHGHQVSSLPHWRESTDGEKAFITCGMFLNVLKPAFPECSWSSHPWQRHPLTLLWWSGGSSLSSPYGLGHRDWGRWSHSVDGHSCHNLTIKQWWTNTG